MEKIYSDFSFNFNTHPITGDISIISNEKSINQSLKNIAMRDVYETPFRKNMAGGIYSLLFELATPFVTQDVKARLTTAFESYEPRIDIQDIYAKWDEKNLKILITIIYTSKTSTEDIKLDFYLDRVV